MTDVIGQFEQAVLLVLVRLGKDAYGRAILNELQVRLNRDVSAGAVYSTLERLETKGLASSKLAPGTAIRGGRARRYFAPTGAGVRALNDAKSATDNVWRGFACRRCAHEKRGPEPTSFVILATLMLIELGYGALVGAIGAITSRWTAPEAPRHVRVS